MENKKLVNYNWVTAVLLAALFSLLLVQCKKDDPQAPATTTPPVDPKLRFIASWTCTEVSRRDPPAQPFVVHIADSVADIALMENFYALGFAKKAKLIIYGDSLKFSPINQSVTPGVVLLNGKGKLINASTIKMTYIVDDGLPIKDTVDATFTK